jgi:hypothetical protein
MKHSERLRALIYNARRRRGPACGKRWIVNDLFDAADSFYRSLLKCDSTWIGVPRWRGRYKALRRSRMARGQSVNMMDLLVKVTREWGDVMKIQTVPKGRRKHEEFGLQGNVGNKGRD